MGDPQYCLLAIDHWSTCMTKAEWASWTQALGSIAAILAAGASVWYQVHKSYRLAKADADWRERRTELNHKLRLMAEMFDLRGQAKFFRDRYGSREFVSMMGFDGVWPSVDEVERIATTLESFTTSEIAAGDLKIAHMAAREARHVVATIKEVGINWRAMDSTAFSTFFSQLDDLYTHVDSAFKMIATGLEAPD